MIISRLLLVIQIFLYLLPWQLLGHSRDPKFEQISVEKGLSHIAVYSILQDFQGYLWIGTANGLNRYDGYKFEKFYSDIDDMQSLSNDTIRAIVEQDENMLWVLSVDGVLNQFSRNTYKVKRFSLNTHGRILFSAMIIDSQKMIWLASNKGIFSFDTGSYKFRRPTSYNSKHIFNKDLDVRSILIDSSDKMWIGTAGEGAFQFEIPKSKLSNVLFDQINPISVDTVYDIYEDSRGLIWFGTNHGLVKHNPVVNTDIIYQRDKYNNQTLASDGVYSICEDLTGTSRFLWLGTIGGGINLLDVDKEIVHRHTCESNTLCCLGSNIINTIFKDRSGVVWFGTDCCGLNKFLGRDIQFENIESIVKVPGGWGHNPVWRFHEDNKRNIWMATSNGLKKLDRENKKLVHFDYDKDNPNSLSNNIVTTLLEDKTGNLWIGTEFGLNRLIKNKNKFEKFLHSPYNSNTLSDNGIVCLMQDAAENLWIGTRIGGVNKFIPRTGSFEQFGGNVGDPGRVIKTAVLDIIESDAMFGKSVWIATYNDGLLELNQDTEEIKKYEHDPANSESISHNSVSALLEDDQGNLWIGTNGGGLNKYNRKQNVFKHFIEKDGLPDKTIFALVMDDKNKIWISTARGISRFDPVTEVFRNYSLGGSSLINRLEYGTLYRSRDGWLYYSTFGGILAFNPDNMRVESIIPHVVITDFRLANDEDYPQDNYFELNNISLNFDQNFFTFEFAVLDYIDPEKNQYSYKLNGIDRTWNYSGSRNSASYTDVRPGTYTFEVRGSNSDGIWNNSGATIELIINPPPWLTWWAYAIYFLIFSIGLVAVNRIVVKRDRLKNLAKVKEFEAQKLEEINEMKTRFFTNISHEIRTPLTLILGPLEKIISLTRNKQTRMYLNIMHRNAHTLHSLINQLLDHEKLETGLMRLNTKRQDLVLLVKKYIMSFTPLAESQGKVLSVNSSLTSNEVYIDSEKLHKILSNLISNAVKFSQKKVSIEISKTKPQKIRIGSPKYFMPNTEYICISIMDDGCGIPEEEIDKIFDRFYTVKFTRNAHVNGTGIGLSLAKDLVELHHGFIDVESTPGQGSTFFVFLPLGSEHLQAQEIEEFRKDGYPEDMLADGQTLAADNIYSKSENHVFEGSDKLVILIVEDNNEMIVYLRSIFQENYQLLDAINGSVAYKKAVSEIPDLIISDIMMPGSDGFYLVQKLKSDERTSHIPVILLTAKASMQTKLDGLKLGADDYIIKPFEEKELVARVENLIEQRQALRRRFSDRPYNDYNKNVPTQLDEKFLKKVIEFVEEHISDPELSVEYLAGMLRMSRVQLHRKLSALTGNAPSEFIRKLRIHTAAGLLARKSGNVFEVAYQVGFNNLSYFAKCFREEYGMAPSEYIRGAVDEKS